MGYDLVILLCINKNEMLKRKNVIKTSLLKFLCV